MSKLTERQKANIRAKYAAGGISYKTLAAEYGVSETLVRNVCKNAETAELCREEKKRAEMSMREFFQSRAGKAQSLIDIILDLDPGELATASLRDKMGALKILRESFYTDDSESKAKSALDDLCAKLDAVAEAGTAEDEHGK